MHTNRVSLDGIPPDIHETLPVPENGAFCLTQKEVDKLRQIIAKESGEVLSDREAWVRVIEVLAFAKILLESMAAPRYFNRRPGWSPEGCRWRLQNQILLP